MGTTILSGPSPLRESGVLDRGAGNVGEMYCQAADTDPEAKRKRELEEVKAELAQPLLNGDKVLMTVIKVDVTYEVKGDITKVVCFFDDGSSCSIIKNSFAVKLGLWG